jgi:hypothetical protein
MIDRESHGAPESTLPGGVQGDAPTTGTGDIAEEVLSPWAPPKGSPLGDPNLTLAELQRLIRERKLTDEDIDTILMVVLDSPDEAQVASVLEKMPGLAMLLQKPNDLLASDSGEPSEEETETFLGRAVAQGLVKPDRPLTWREYLGAFLPPK